MNIIDFIPYGKENAVKRSTLCALTGMSDRKVREMIERERCQGYVIANCQDGNGYYQTNDLDEVIRQFRQEHRRALSIHKRQAPLRKIIRASGYRIDQNGKIFKEV